MAAADCRRPGCYRCTPSAARRSDSRSCMPSRTASAKLATLSASEPTARLSPCGPKVCLASLSFLTARTPMVTPAASQMILFTASSFRPSAAAAALALGGALGARGECGPDAVGEGGDLDQRGAHGRGHQGRESCQIGGGVRDVGCDSVHLAQLLVGGAHGGGDLVDQRGGAVADGAD